MTGTVPAAGGVIVRDGAEGAEVLLVHRPAYDDWTFPKGKVERGETHEQCALREVQEETGLVCLLVGELPSTEYMNGRGRPKRVRWWRMEAVDGALAFDAEVDEAVWVTLERAVETLSYPRDHVLVDAVRGE